MQKTIYSFTLAFGLLMLFNQTVFAQKVAEPGDLIISEFMANPAAVSDTKGEWIELYNPGSINIIINGLILQDLGSNHHLIEADYDLLVPAGGYLLMGRNADVDENGGIEPDYIYSNFTLGNSEDEIYLLTADSTLIDAVSYNEDWATSSGVSLELDPAITDTTANNEPGNWHPASAAYGAGDLGTPGKQNTTLAIWDFTNNSNILKAYPNPCEKEINIEIAPQPGQRSTVSIVNVLGQKFLCYADPTGLKNNIKVDLSTFTKGVYWLEFKSGDDRAICTLLKN